MKSLIKTLLRENLDIQYAVIEILKTVGYMSLPYYYQIVPLHQTKENKISVNRGSAGTVTISTKNIKVLKVFDSNQTQEMNDYLKQLREKNT
ncbi:MAG: hypothetical protein WCK82_03595 [Bacteroidota bacterium]